MCANRRMRTKIAASRRPRLVSEGRKLQRPQELDLMLELDSVRLVRSTSCLGHKGDRIRGACAVRVLDEVGVPRRDLGAPDAMAFQAAGLEHPSRAQLVLRVLEDAAESPLVRRLRRLPQRLQLADPPLDLGWVARLQTELDPRDDLAPSEPRVPVGETELVRRPPG